jgi:undecaprenyl-diphosphatase
VSSSGHLVLVPALLGWRYGELDAELRKSFEVALHAGTAAALLIVLRREVGEVVRELDGRRLARHLLEMAPAAAAALAFERPIEERLGTPRRVAVAQVAAGAALAAADLSPARRAREEATMADALAIGAAQAAALAPGVSRNGATLTAARLLRFERPAANRLSRHAALPIIVAATGLKGFRLAGRGLPRRMAAPFGAGLAAAFASTLASSRVVRWMDAAPSYAPFAAYRMMLGSLALHVLTRR